MQKILVTGATGFIGAALVKELVRRGENVRITVRKHSDRRNLRGISVEEVEADVVNPGEMRKAMHGCTHLYHVAGLYRSWMRDYGQLIKVNVEGSRNTLQAAFEAGIHKVIYTSSIAALGIRADGKPSDETTPYNLFHMKLPYELSKYQGELVAHEFIRRGLPAVIVRPALVMGEGDIYPTPSGQIVLNILKGKVPSYFHGGIEVVDVDDVVAGHILAMERGRAGESYNLGCRGNFTTMKNMFDIIARAGGVRAPFLKVPRAFALAYACALSFIADCITHTPPVATPDNIRILSAMKHVDFSKATEELGIPQTPLKAVIEKTVRWYQNEGYV